MKRAIFYVGVTSIYPNIKLLNPNISTSMVSVTFDRDKLEEIRRSRNISVNSMAKKIGLSRSRYYRWLDNEIDLPFDLLIGIQKLLGMTTLEMHQLFSQSDDELIQKTSLLAYHSLALSQDICHTIHESLLKHQYSTMKNDPYLFLISFSNLCVSYADSDDLSFDEDAFTKVIEVIFIRDIWTTIDIIMLVTMAYMFPKKISPFLPEIYNKICDIATAISISQRISFLYDLLCITVTLGSEYLTLKILKKLVLLEPWTADWKAKSICQLSKIMLDHWQFKNISDNEIEPILNFALLFESSDYEQKIKQLIKIYRDF